MDVSRADMVLIVFLVCILQGTGTEVSRQARACYKRRGLLAPPPAPAPEVSRERIQQLQKDRLFSFKHLREAVRDSLPTCTRRDPSPLPIPANPG